MLELLLARGDVTTLYVARPGIVDASLAFFAAAAAGVGFESEESGPLATAYIQWRLQNVGEPGADAALPYRLSAAAVVTSLARAGLFEEASKLLSSLSASLRGEDELALLSSYLRSGMRSLAKAEAEARREGGEGMLPWGWNEAAREMQGALRAVEEEMQKRRQWL